MDIFSTSSWYVTFGILGKIFSAHAAKSALTDFKALSIPAISRV
jgi:hypothetical protein